MRVYAEPMKVEISPERQAWLEREVACGGWRSPAELVEAALRAYERDLADLRRDIAEADRAIQVGEGVSETADAFLARMKAKRASAA
jgi:Arc/MetJ-type ribon-helix-helix transcriptional regulator